MRRVLILTCAIVLADTIFYAALTPLVPYYTDTLGLSKSTVGVLSGAFGAGVLVGAAPAGLLGARAGAKPVALAGLVLMATTSLVFGLAETTWLLVLMRFAGGFGSALSWVAAFTWLVGRAPEERRGELIGVMISAAVFGGLLGPVLGSVAATVGIFPTFAAVAVAGLAIALWAALEPAPPSGFTIGEGQSAAEILRTMARPRVLTGVWLIALAPLLFSALAVLVPLQLNGFGWGAAAVGAVFLASAAFEAVVHPPLGRWVDRSGYHPPVRVGLVASIGILLLLPVSGGPWLLGLLVVLAAGAFNASLVPGTALLSRGAEKAGMAPAIGFGVTNFAWASGYAVGAPLGGALADLGGDALSYGTLAVVCVLTLLVMRRPALPEASGGANIRP